MKLTKVRIGGLTFTVLPEGCREEHELESRPCYIDERQKMAIYPLKCRKCGWVSIAASPVEQLGEYTLMLRRRGQWRGWGSNE